MILKKGKDHEKGPRQQVLPTDRISHTHTHKHNTLKQRRAKIFGEKFAKVLQDD